MKIQCDVCNKDEATLFCVADEAALCEACDHGVHHANKLAGKHQRFSLLKPSAKEIPVCDICQERKAFLFCQQDRAILCRECDNSIHKANEHTQKHIRFLLTGVKLSATSTLYSSPSSSNGCDIVPIFKSQQNSIKKHVSSSSISQNVQKTTILPNENNLMMNGSTSSISEYLMEMLPGWHVEDFLDSSSPNGYSKDSEDYIQPFWDGGALDKNQYSSPLENTSLWVPQVPPPILSTTTPQKYPYDQEDIAFGAQIGFKESKKDDVTLLKPIRKLSDDLSFAVPQIKRSRTLW